MYTELAVDRCCSSEKFGGRQEAVTSTTELERNATLEADFRGHGRVYEENRRVPRTSGRWSIMSKKERCHRATPSLDTHDAHGNDGSVEAMPRDSPNKVGWIPCEHVRLKEEAGYALIILLDEENRAALRKNSGSRVGEASGQSRSTPTSLTSPSMATESARPLGTSNRDSGTRSGVVAPGFLG